MALCAAQVDSSAERLFTDVWVGRKPKQFTGLLLTGLRKTPSSSGLRGTGREGALLEAGGAQEPDHPPTRRHGGYRAGGSTLLTGLCSTRVLLSQ